MVACEQAALDDGDCSLVWLLTHMAEPPWARLLTRGATLRTQQFGQLADPAWIAAATGHLKDLQAVQGMRKRSGAPAREDEKQHGPKRPKREMQPGKTSGAQPTS